MTLGIGKNDFLYIKCQFPLFYPSMHDVRVARFLNVVVFGNEANFLFIFSPTL